MKIINKLPLTLDTSFCGRLSCLVRSDNSFLGIDTCGYELCTLNTTGAICRKNLLRNYEKITYNSKNNTYFAITRNSSESLFVLDNYFQEIDHNNIRLGENRVQLEDIWFDEDTDLIWAITNQHIYRLNCNGDSLGTFMSAPQGTEYKAICTHGDFIFVAYTKLGCFYIASYTKQGAYLERLNLGSEYNICNLQVFTVKGGLHLHIFALSRLCSPFILEMELCANEDKPIRCLQKECSDFSVECICENPQIHSTCYISHA